MALEMRGECAGCATPLPPDWPAFICSHECTYCALCADGLHHTCPTCGGELVARPRRAVA